MPSDSSAPERHLKAGEPGHVLDKEADRDWIQTLSRGLAVIRSFGVDCPSMTVSEVAARTGISRAAARRCLLTLVHDGYALSNGKLFWLAPKVLDLGYAYLSSLDIGELARPLMEEVVRRTRESCSIAVLDGTEIVYVARVLSSRVVTVGLGVGSRLPAYATSLGRVLLAALEPRALDAYFAAAQFQKLTDRTTTSETELRRILAHVREVGWAMVDEELASGLRTLAVPIRDRGGDTIAALNICSHSSRTTAQEIILNGHTVLSDAAERLSGKVGLPPPRTARPGTINSLGSSGH